MLDQFKALAINTLVKKLNDNGVNVDAATVERAIANSPHLLQQIEAIISASDSKDRIAKVRELLNNAASEDTTTKTK